MKFIKYILPVLFLTVVTQSCQDFLEREPLGRETDKTFFEDNDNAVLAVNAIYDAISWDEGGLTGSGHNYEWMYGDVLSDDASKGSTPGDYIEISQMEKWELLAGAGIPSSTWNNMYAAIYRANQVILNLPESKLIDAELKNRLLGEAYFLRAYCYINLVTKFGGVPLIIKPVEPSDWGKVERSSIAGVYQQVESDLKEAIDRLPEKSAYPETELGRATKGAARAYLARAYMYQIGTDNSNGISWQQVYDQTKAIMTSGQYSLEPNYAKLFEMESENGPESIFEIQFTNSTGGYGPIKTGTTNSVIQGNRATYGWGFNNPTNDLASAFEAKDPRKAVTMYTDGDVVQGEAQIIDPSQNDDGFLNRKVALEPAFRPSDTKDSPQNIMKFRLGDIYLMQAEAAYYLGMEPEARDLVNAIRTRARNSTKPKGSEVGTTDYKPYTDDMSNVLPEVTSSVTGPDLLEAILHERRVELAMESLRFYDLVRTGRYFDALSKIDPTGTITANAQTHTITGFVHPIPVMPIPLNEVQDWNLAQNPGY